MRSYYFPIFVVFCLAVVLAPSTEGYAQDQSVLKEGVFVSVAAEDGWVRERRENSETGGRKNTSASGSASLRMGDHKKDRQYKSLLSFNTGSLPDDAEIVSAVLELTRGKSVGETFSSFGKGYVDIRKGKFGGSKALENSDFEASADAEKAGVIEDQGGAQTVYQIALQSDALQFINKKGVTQLRFYYAKDDNDNSTNDLTGFYSANNSNSAKHPVLVISYKVGTIEDPPADDPPADDPPADDPPADDPPADDPPADDPGAVWSPKPGTSWQWQLTGSVDTSFDVDMYDIDLFDVSKSVIDKLHGDGRVVICYFSAGSWEDWRPDANQFPAEVKAKSNGWAGEKWLDIRKLDILAPIMEARLDLAVEKGCDGVEPDNIDGYTNNTGVSLSANDQLTYNKFLAAAAHQRGLSIGLKNDVDQVDELVDHFDWALNEECFQYDECELLLPFVQAGKAVFGVEYSGSTSSFCPKANLMNFDWLKKRLDLDAYRVACR